MSVNEILAHQVVRFLNSALAHDTKAINELVSTRVPCGKAIATHPSIQVQVCKDDPTAVYRVGMLGLLNGMVGKYDDGPHKGYGAIIADLDDGQIVRFRVLPNLTDADKEGS
jgi:hypothetical protein